MWSYKNILRHVSYEMCEDIVCKIHIEDRKYTAWKCLDIATMQPLEPQPEIDPIKSKVVSNDTIVISSEGEVSVKYSPVRDQEYIAGVLDLKSNKTYGRDRLTGKLLYRVVPDDIRLPVFLVPYEMKHMGFSKVFVNMYVTFKYVLWEGKHPYGKLVSSIGAVDEQRSRQFDHLCC